MQEQELFQRYELKGWQFSPRLYKIIGASALINLLAFFLMAQANFLTGKTCDSPIASGVCSVLDALYVGSVIADTNNDYISKEYVKTELGDEEITYINVGDYEPFKYPADYFSIANPEQQTTQIIDPTLAPSGDIAGFPSNPTITNGTNDLSNTPQILPDPNQGAVTNLPKSVTNFPRNSTTIKKGNGKKNNSLTNESPNELPDDKTLAENKTDETQKEDEDKIEEVPINKKPLEDFADLILPQWAAKEVDLNQQFIVVMNGELTKDGQLDMTKSKWVTNEIKGDPKIVEIAKEAVESVGESGWLRYLYNFNVKKLKITLAQDNDKIIALIESNQESAERANTLASRINNGIKWAKLGIKGADEKTLLESAKPTSNGKVFIIRFELPKPKAQEMINRKLQEAQLKKQQENSTSQNTNTNQSAAK
jgi:hypothetical protein